MATEPEAAYDPTHHVPHTPAVLMVGASAALAALNIIYGQVGTSAGLAGLLLGLAVVATVPVMRRHPGPRLVVMLSLFIAEVLCYRVLAAT